MKKFPSLFFCGLLFVLFSFCSRKQNEESELLFLDFSSPVSTINSPVEIPVILEALQRLHLVRDGDRYRCLTTCCEDVNISSRLFEELVSVINNVPKYLVTRSGFHPNDCVARALMAWGVNYSTAYNVLTTMYGTDGVPIEDLLDAIKLFVPTAVQFAPDSIPLSYSNSFNFSHSLAMYYDPNDLTNAHMVNIAFKQNNIIFCCEAVDSTQYSLSEIKNQSEFAKFFFRP